MMDTIQSVTVTENGINQLTNIHMRLIVNLLQLVQHRPLFGAMEGNGLSRQIYYTDISVNRHINR